MRKNRLNKKKQFRLIEHFVAGTSARCAAYLAGVNFKTASHYFHRLREFIAEKSTIKGWTLVTSKSMKADLAEVYEQKRAWATGVVPVFGILKRGVKE